MKTVYSPQQIADQLTRDGGHWYGDNGDGVIRYSFSESLGSFGSGQEYGLDSTQQMWVQTALSQISSIIELEFVEVAEPSNASRDYPIGHSAICHCSRTGNLFPELVLWGMARSPFPTLSSIQTGLPIRAATLNMAVMATPPCCTRFFTPLGLEHPGEYNAGSGQNITYDNSAEFQQDTPIAIR